MKASQRNAISTSTTVAIIVVILVVAVVAAYFVLIPSATTASTTTTTTASPTSSSQEYTVQIRNSASIGNYLENGTGFTLYMFGADKPGNGTSTCTGTCAAVWPPFYASSLNLPSGLSSSSFSAITRSDGTKQTTYNGWPLYYYAADKSAGSVTGEGLNQLGGLWYAIPPTLTQTGGQIIGGASYGLGVAYKPSVGIYLTNSTGFTLYFRSTDTPNSGTTTCNTDACEKNWPAFYTSTTALAPGLNSAAFGTITPYNSTKIATYDGYALFYWIGDASPGDTLGQGIGQFYVATVPTLVAPSGTTTTTTSTTTTSIYGY
jgi:predicted lipoprotein with Yx(FWY)xxD motif